MGDFRVDILGLTAPEFAASTGLVPNRRALKAGTIKSLEGGGKCSRDIAGCCAVVIDLAMKGELFPKPSAEVSLKINKPDTTRGWSTIQRFAREGVSLPIFLHQRFYGGAFRQLLDATSSKRGNVIEDAVQQVLDSSGIPYVRTGTNNQDEIARRFQVTVKPAPDFVIFDASQTLRALIECKGANDGGTARDKAARFSRLRAESVRLGGVPLVAILAGLGWQRTNDALGPVVRDTDGRVLTLATLDELTSMQPFSTLSKGVNRS